MVKFWFAERATAPKVTAATTFHIISMLRVVSSLGDRRTVGGNGFVERGIAVLFAFKYLTASSSQNILCDGRALRIPQKNQLGFRTLIVISLELRLSIRRTRRGGLAPFSLSPGRAFGGVSNVFETAFIFAEFRADLRGEVALAAGVWFV
jgi:hypothetical protein